MKTDIKKVNQKLRINLPNKDFKTVGGFIIDLMGKVPRVGEEVKYKNLRIKIVEIEKGRVRKIKIKKL